MKQQCTPPVDVEGAISFALSSISVADECASHMRANTGASGFDDFDSANGLYESIELAYEALLLLTETLGLEDATKRLSAAYSKAKKHEDGLHRVQADPYGNVESIEAGRLRRVAKGLQSVFGIGKSSIVSKDILSILRATQYAITDPGCFSESPQSEADVHHRVEAVLRCVFPDLRSKLPVSKPIKNFEPDTGLPSVKTLVEYKFVENMADVKRVADEILADTRGYVSSDWNNFVFLIYETKRLKSETEWNNLLHDCGTAANTQAIVICGETTRKTASNALGRGRIASSEKASAAGRKPRRKSEGGR